MHSICRPVVYLNTNLEFYSKTSLTNKEQETCTAIKKIDSKSIYVNGNRTDFQSKLRKNEK